MSKAKTVDAFPSRRATRLLIVEDSAADAELAVKVLQRAGYPLTFDVVDSAPDLEERLAHNDYDAILCDHNLATWTGLDALEIFKRSGKEIPFIVLTSVLGDEAAVEYVKQGATDYVLKHRLERLPVALSRALRDKTHREEAARLQEQIVLAKRDWELTFDSVPDPIILVDEESCIRRVNRAMVELVGLEFSQVVGKRCHEVMHRSDKPPQNCPHQCLLRTGREARADIEEPRLGKIFDHACTPLRDSSGALMGSIIVLRDITERKRAEVALRESEEHFRSLIENLPVGVYRTTPDGRVLMGNPTLLRTFGYDSLQELATRNLECRSSEAGYSRSAFLEQIEREGEARGFQAAWKRPDGSEVFVRESARAIRAEDGKVLYYDGIVEDVTERQRLEEQLRQAQKMEAVGRLAGGVAHDFNNLLTVIIGYSDFVLGKLPDSDRLLRPLGEIKKAAERAALLTRRLLAFSRRQVLQPQILDLTSLLRSVEEMLRRTIGEDIELAMSLPSGLGHVKADPGQIEQVIMNLAVNARDAMPQGGKLTVEAANVELDSSYVQSHESVVPGPYVMLAVSDTGTGMDTETQGHMFEPFFTTKEQGTGLGLATVYGIVRQSGGHVWVYSEPEKGTTFKVYLPRVDPPVEVNVSGEVSVEEPPQGSENILLVEDEEAVRSLVKETLEGKGYEVLEAKGAHEALEVGDRHKETIHLLLTDVVMPQMSGTELAKVLAPLHPETKVLYMSGYTENATLRHGLLDPGTAILQKPFTADALTRKLREVLDSAGVQKT